MHSFRMFVEELLRGYWHQSSVGPLVLVVGSYRLPVLNIPGMQMSLELVQQSSHVSPLTFPTIDTNGILTSSTGFSTWLLWLKRTRMYRIARDCWNCFHHEIAWNDSRLASCGLQNKAGDRAGCYFQCSTRLFESKLEVEHLLDVLYLTISPIKSRLQWFVSSF